MAVPGKPERNKFMARHPLRDDEVQIVAALEEDGDVHAAFKQSGCK